jgi:hypothetical protein
MPYIGKTTDGFGVRNRFVYLASSGDTSVSGADANGATLTFTDGAYVDVYLNGVLLKPTTDYNTSTANTIAGLSALNTNDEVTVVVYDIFTVADMVSATSGGTFSGNVTMSGDATIGDDLTFSSDGAVLSFGADADVTLTHVADQGLTLKSTATDGASGLGPILNLSTGDTDIAQANQLGTINFQAPDEGTGTDATAVVASITAIAQEDFAADANGTSLLLRSSDSGTNDGGYLEIKNDKVVEIRGNLELDRSSESSTDVVLYFNGNGVDWTLGTDASDSGNLKFSNSSAVGTNSRMIFKAGGLIEHYADRDGNLNYFQNSHSSSPYGLSVAFDQASPDNNTNYFLKCADSSATRCTIFSDGDVATADAGTLSSDEKLKNTITDATDKWDDVKKLKVRNFYWNEDYHPKKKDKKMIGFIAQEFETVFPGLVKNYKDTIDKEVEDENGVKSIEAVETGTTTKHIKEGKLIPILTKALQEAMTRIETLEAKVKTLEEA